MCVCVSVPKNEAKKKIVRKLKPLTKCAETWDLRATEHPTWPEVWPKCGAAQAAAPATAAPITSRAGLLPEAIRHLMHLRAKFCTKRKNKIQI